MEYSAKYQPASSSSSVEQVQADNVLQTLEEYLPQGYLTNHDEFIDVVRSDFTSFKPLGEKIYEYTRENDNGSVENFEIFKVRELIKRYLVFRLMCLCPYYRIHSQMPNLESTIHVCSCLFYYLLKDPAILKMTMKNGRFIPGMDACNWHLRRGLTFVLDF